MYLEWMLCYVYVWNGRMKKKCVHVLYCNEWVYRWGSLDKCRKRWAVVRCQSNGFKCLRITFLPLHGFDSGLARRAGQSAMVSLQDLKLTLDTPSPYCFMFDNHNISRHPLALAQCYCQVSCKQLGKCRSLGCRASSSDTPPQHYLTSPELPQCVKVPSSSSYPRRWQNIQLSHICLGRSCHIPSIGSLYFLLGTVPVL